MKKYSLNLTILSLLFWCKSSFSLPWSIWLLIGLFTTGVYQDIKENKEQNPIKYQVIEKTELLGGLTAKYTYKGTLFIKDSSHKILTEIKHKYDNNANAKGYVNITENDNSYSFNNVMLNSQEYVLISGTAPTA